MSSIVAEHKSNLVKTIPPPPSWPISTARVRNPAGFEAIEAKISIEYWINSFQIKFKTVEIGDGVIVIKEEK